MMPRHPVIEILILLITVVILATMLRSRMYPRGSRSPSSYVFPLLIAVVITPVLWYGLLVLLAYLHEPPS